LKDFTGETVFSRRHFLKALGCLSGGFFLQRNSGCPAEAKQSKGVWLNDIHTGLNATRVSQVLTASSSEAVQEIVQQAAKAGHQIAIGGGRHAAGGQQFLKDQWSLDTRPMSRILSFHDQSGDDQLGLMTVQAGISWTAIMKYLNSLQEGQIFQWAIKQKPTGSDSITLGGSIGANNHGRCLQSAPLVSDIESFRLILASGEVKNCSRRENKDLFSLVLGGYGMFGVVSDVTLRLVKRQKLRRQVQEMSVEDVYQAYQDAVKAGCTYGAFDFSFDPTSDGYLRDGFFLSYLPVGDETPVSSVAADFDYEKWLGLTTIIHQDKARTYQQYKGFYQTSAGLIYYHDTAQLGPYKDYYHLEVDKRLHRTTPGTEAITEVYVPKEKLAAFLGRVKTDFIQHQVDFIYGTVRFIQPDTESVMPWAKGDFACIIFNIHVEKTPQGLAKGKRTLQQIIDRALAEGGTYYLTYHRYATKSQVLAAYPEMPSVLALKRQYDPAELFQSTWYQHYRKMFAESVF
jgi:FAD/FMN-containing dehydrogenase